VRAKVVLLLAAGRSISGVASALRQERRIVRKWAMRFFRKRLCGLEDAPRTGGPPVLSAVFIAEWNEVTHPFE
jgi:transposase